MSKVFFHPEAVFRERAIAIAATETARIRTMIPSADVQHIGATSIVGALTKGDVDLVATIPASELDSAVKALCAVYAINQPENWTPTFASFKDDTSFALPFGVQVVVRESEIFFFVRLRERLKNDPLALAGYNAIKLAHEGQDAANYREAKSEFIERLLAESKP